MQFLIDAGFKTDVIGDIEENNEELNEAHNSMADIEGTMRIYNYLCKNLLPIE